MMVTNLMVPQHQHKIELLVHNILTAHSRHCTVKLFCKSPWVNNNFEDSRNIYMQYSCFRKISVRVKYWKNKSCLALPMTAEKHETIQHKKCHITLKCSLCKSVLVEMFCIFCCLLAVSLKYVSYNMISLFINVQSYSNIHKVLQNSIYFSYPLKSSELCGD